MIAPADPNIEPDGGVVLKVVSPRIYFSLPPWRCVHEECGSQCSLPVVSHVNLNCRDIEAINRFFQGVLGFVLTDRSRLWLFSV